MEKNSAGDKNHQVNLLRCLVLDRILWEDQITFVSVLTIS
jgi:hypothetical protein